MRVLGTRLQPKINHKTAGRKIILKKKNAKFHFISGTAKFFIDEM